MLNGVEARELTEISLKMMNENITNLDEKLSSALNNPGLEADIISFMLWKISFSVHKDGAQSLTASCRE